MTHETAMLVVATGNPGKLVEIRALLGDLPINLLSLADFPDLVPAEEDAPNLEGNAIKKARSVFEATGIQALADDTGLEVDALGGAPGVMSARFAGPECDPVMNRAKLQRNLAAAVDRRARFRTVVALVSGAGVATFHGVCEGTIAEVERGSGGFGYDALFVPAGRKETFAEMDPSDKNLISHRGKALRKLRAYLESLTIAAGL